MLLPELFGLGTWLTRFHFEGYYIQDWIPRLWRPTQCYFRFDDDVSTYRFMTATEGKMR